ncbi:dihydrofolate reductase family protein [Paenibacillus tarimensis]
MRKLVLSMMISIDGYIEGENQNLDWFAWDDEMESYMLDYLRNFDTFIYGRKAYETMVGYWPEAAANPVWPDRDIEFVNIMNETPKLVLSNTLDKVQWNAKLFGKNPAQEVKQLKAQEGKNIALFAGASAAAYFMREGLVDEYHLIINPVILGSGNTLFKGTEATTSLQLRSTRSTSTGIVILTYSR